MKKKLVSVLLAGVMALALAACGGSSNAASSSEAEAPADTTAAEAAPAEGGDGSYAIDVIVKTTASEYWGYVVAGANAYSKDHPEVTVSVKGATSETSYDEQQNMIETDLNSGAYDGFVIAPLQADLVATLIKGQTAPIVAVDTNIEAPEVLSFVGTSNEDAAKMGGEEAVKAAKEAGWDEIKAICISGVMGDSTATARLTGYEEGINGAGGEFLILVYNIYRLGVIGYGICLIGSGIGGHLQVGEGGFNLLLHLVHIKVAHYYYALQVGTVPFLIISSERGGTKAVDDREQADGHAVAVLGAGVKLRQLALQYALHGRGAQTPLLVDHTALLVDLLGVEQQFAGPVAQDEQTAVHIGAADGHIVDVVDCLVGRGVSIDVAAELDADPLAEGDDAVAGEMLRPVEAHVLQEVGQAALAVVLLHGADLLRDVEEGSVDRQGVMTNVICEARRQMAVSYGGVHRHGRYLGRSRGGKTKDKQSRRKHPSQNVSVTHI